jgi:hypothetical protein
VENNEFELIGYLHIYSNHETFTVGDLVVEKGTEDPVFCITEISEKKYLSGSKLCTLKYKQKVKVQKIKRTGENIWVDWESRVFTKNFPFTKIGKREDLIET